MDKMLHEMGEFILAKEEVERVEYLDDMCVMYVIFRDGRKWIVSVMDSQL